MIVVGNGKVKFQKICKYEIIKVDATVEEVEWKEKKLKRKECHQIQSLRVVPDQPILWM